MIEISKLIYDGISKDQSYEVIIKNIKEDAFLFVSKIYKDYYDNKTPKEVLIYTKKNKFFRRKKQWMTKANEGLTKYKHDNTLTEKGHYRHLVDNYIMMQEYENQKGTVAFKKMFKENDSESAIKRYSDELNQWGESRKSLLCEYPFYTDLSTNQQRAAAEIDMVVMIGEWLVENLDKIEVRGISDGKIMVDSNSLVESQDFVERAPTTSLNHPYWGVSKKDIAAINDNTLDSEENSLFSIKRKTSFEMGNDYDLFLDSKIIESYRSIEEQKGDLAVQSKGSFIDSQIVESYTNKIRTPDMADWRLFVYLINRRHKKFQQNRRIQVYFSDIIEDNYKSDSGKVYKTLTDRLLRLGFYRMASKTIEGTLKLSSLFSDLTIEKDEDKKWYVKAVVSDSVYDDVIKQQTINIYNKKVKELENDFAYHLVFVLQKERIMNYTTESEEITFSMDWEDFSSIRFNKRTKRENFDEIEKALKEIKEKDFLVKEFKRISNSSFVITFYPLNNYELEDMNTMNLTYPVDSLMMLNKSSEQ